MERRGFLKGMLALGAAPWVAKAGVLMPVKKIIAPPLFTGEVGKYESIILHEGGQIWAPNELGGYMYSLNLSEELRKSLQPMSRFMEYVTK